MALREVPANSPYFTVSSSDVVNNKVAGLDSPSVIGLRVYITDAKVWKIINEDYTLSDYIVNSDLQVSDIQIGAVEVKDATTGNRLVVDSNGKISTKQADGDSITLGTKADSAITDPTVSSSIVGNIKGIMTYIKNIITANRVQVDVSALPTGTNIIGQLSIDQTTNGTTNGVSGTRKNDGTDTAAGKFHLTVGGNDGINLKSLSVDTTGKVLLGAGTNNIGKITPQIGGVDVANTNPIPTKRFLSQTQIGADIDFTFANSAVINTNATAIDITKPSLPSEEYMLTIYNPSTVSDLTVKIFAIASSLAGGTKYAYITNLTVPKSASIFGTTVNTYSFYVHGIFNNSDCRIIISNNTALGVSDGFTGTLRVREV